MKFAADISKISMRVLVSLEEIKTTSDMCKLVAFFAVDDKGKSIPKEEAYEQVLDMNKLEVLAALEDIKSAIEKATAEAVTPKQKGS